MEELTIKVPTEPWGIEASQNISEAYEFFGEAQKQPDLVLQTYDSDPARYLEHTKSAEEAWQQISGLDNMMNAVVKELATNGKMIATHLQQARSQIDMLWTLPKIRSQTSLHNITDLEDYGLSSYGCEAITRVIRFYKTYQELDEDTYNTTLEEITQRD